MMEMIKWLWWMNSFSILYTLWLISTWFMLGLIVK